MGLIAKHLGKIDATSLTATTVGTSQALHTNLTTLDTIVTSITMHNQHTSGVIVTLVRTFDNAESAGTPDADDEMWQQTVDASDTAVYDVPIPMTDTNDIIRVYTNTSGKVTVWADGFTLPDQS